MTNTLKDANPESSEGVSKLAVVATTQSAVTTLTESLPYFELAWHRLEKQNHGAPECPDIALNEKKSSETKPQAWSQEINGQIFWYYNYPGACAEAQHLSKTVPTIDQWMEMLASVSGNTEEKAQTLGISMASHREAVCDEFDTPGDYAGLWSASPFNEVAAHIVVLGPDYVDTRTITINHGNGLSLRFLSNTK